MNFDFEKLKPIAEWLLGKLTPLSMAFIAIGILAKVAAGVAKLLGYTHEALDTTADWTLYFWTSIAFVVVIYSIQKHTKQSAKIAAEQIVRTPGPSTSDIPAVQKEIDKIEEKVAAE